MSKPIRCVKLIGGEVVMGFFSENKLGTEIIIEEARECIVDITEGRMEVQLAPWLLFAKDHVFKIRKSSVITVFEARPNLETNYKVSTGNRK